MFKVSKWLYESAWHYEIILGGATTPLVVKIWSKQPMVKFENFCDFDSNFALSRGKI